MPVRPQGIQDLLTQSNKENNMQIIKRPYEILLRFSPAGEMQGAHVGFLTVACDDNGHPLTNADGTYTLLKPEPVQPLAMADDTMKEVLGEANVQLSAECESRRLTNEALTAKLDEVARAAAKCASDLVSEKAKTADLAAKNNDLSTKLAAALAQIELLKNPAAPKMDDAPPAPEVQA